jgi:hypothetical protein
MHREPTPTGCFAADGTTDLVRIEAIEWCDDVASAPTFQIQDDARANSIKKKRAAPRTQQRFAATLKNWSG